MTTLNWRNTPTEGCGISPAEIMFGRKTKSILISTDSQIQKKPDIEKFIDEKLFRHNVISEYFILPVQKSIKNRFFLGKK